jgi:hypothetical protein
MTNAEDSLKNLWQSLPAAAPRYTEAQMQARARKLDAKAKRQHLIDYVAYAVLFGLIAYIHIISVDWHKWIVSGLMTTGAALATWNYHRFARQRIGLPAEPNGKLIEFLRHEFTRQRDYAAGFARGFLLPFIPAIAFIFAIRWMEYGEAPLAITEDRLMLIYMGGFITAFLCACLFWNWLKAANFQRQLNDLDVV